MTTGSLRGLAWNAGWFALGGSLAIANSVRHRLLGYTRPRAFGPGNLERNVSYVLGVADRWQHAGLDPGGRRILELGPGPDLGSGFVLVARGATSYTAIDRFPLAQREPRALYAALAERLGVDAELTTAKMRYVVASIPGPAAVLPENSFDAIVSNATLEHLDDIVRTFSWLARLATPGATHVHVVDAQTHMRGVRPRDPWNILRYPDWLYRLMTFPGAPNRLLASDYLAAAEQAGIPLGVVNGISAADDYLERVQYHLGKSFRARKRSDLALLTFTLSNPQRASSTKSRS
jgi:hypothetical protein